VVLGRPTCSRHEFVNYRPKRNRQHNAHDIHTQFVGRPSHLFQRFLHLCVDAHHSLVDAVHLVVDVVQHDALSLDFLALQRCNFRQVLNALTNFVQLSVKVGVALLQLQNLLLLVLRNGDTAARSTPGGAFAAAVSARAA